MNHSGQPCVEAHAKKRDQNPDVARIQIVDLNGREHEDVQEGHCRKERPSHLILHEAPVKLYDQQDDSNHEEN